MKVFVLMPFDPEFDSVYEELIKAPLVESGHEVTRADSGLDQRNILRDVVEGIAAADLVIADLTARNANVFYELGLCHGLRVPTVLISQSMDDIPFDLRSYRCIPYSTHFQEAPSLYRALRDIAEAHSRERVRFGSPITDHLPTAEQVQTSVGSTPDHGAEVLTTGVPASTEEAGLLDYQQDVEASSEAIKACVSGLGVELQALGKQVREHVASLEGLGDRSAPGYSSRANKVMSGLSNDLEAFVRSAREKLPELGRAIDVFTGGVRGDAEWQASTHGANSEKLRAFKAQTRELASATGAALAGFRSLRASIQDLKDKKISRAVNRATQQMLQVISSLIGQLEKVEASSESTLAFLERDSAQ